MANTCIQKQPYLNICKIQSSVTSLIRNVSYTKCLFSLTVLSLCLIMTLSKTVIHTMLWKIKYFIISHSTYNCSTALCGNILLQISLKLAKKHVECEYKFTVLNKVGLSLSRMSQNLCLLDTFLKSTLVSNFKNIWQIIKPLILHHHG